MAKSTLHHHHRLPAILILAAGAVGGGVYFATARPTGAATQAGTLEEIERRIAKGEADESLWFAYGQRLDEAARFADAAKAYQNVLDKNPESRRALLARAIALAGARQSDELHAHLSDLALDEPKLVLDLLDRPECRAYLTEGRFQKLQKEARAQAMD